VNNLECIERIFTDKSLPEEERRMKCFLQILQEAEKNFGNRDFSWIVQAIKHCPDPTGRKIPCLYYPKPSENFIEIYLSEGSKSNFKCFVFELAHEVVHCLFPTGGIKHNLLEEGLAVYFQIQYSQCDENYINKEPNYKEAYDLVKSLLSLYGENAIVKIREKEPTISKVNVTLLKEVFPTISKELAEKLTEDFI